MTMSGAGAACAVALLQGALVAWPRGNALESLRRVRSPAWAGVLPGCIVVGTFAPLGAHSFALGMVVLAALATPPLAAVAVLSVVRGPRAALAALALIAAVVTTLAGGWSGELSATFLTALSALTVGAALARLIPARWVLAGVVGMSAVDIALLAAGVGHPADAVIAQAAGDVPGPLFDQAHIGPIALGYPDLVLAAVLGGFLAGQQGQRRAAALVTVLAATCLALAPADTMWPATVPLAMTLLALRTIGLPRRVDVKPRTLKPGERLSQQRTSRIDTVEESPSLISDGRSAPAASRRPNSHLAARRSERTPLLPPNRWIDAGTRERDHDSSQPSGGITHSRRGGCRGSAAQAPAG